MKKSITLITMLLLLAVSFVSCGKDDEPALSLNVVSVTPVNNATAIDFRPTISINFDKAVDNTTISGIQLLSPAGTSVSSDVTVSAKSVSLVPKVDLDMGIKYTVKVSGVKATDLGILASEFTSVFTTNDKPSLVGKWVCIYNTNETYKLTFGSNSSFIMTISMPSQNYNGTASGTYVYNETQKNISYTVTGGDMGGGISNYENVKFNSTTQWQTTVGSATLVWNKE